MSMTVDDMRLKSLQARQKKRELARVDARELYKEGKPVVEIAEILGEKYKSNKKPFTIGTIYEYLGGVKHLKDAR